MINALALFLAQAESAEETAAAAAPAAASAASDPFADMFTEHHGSYWFPEQASSYAADVDSLYMLIFWISLFFFAGIVGAMVYFVVKYRARPGHKVEKSPSHNTALEIAWSVLPGFLLVWFFVDGTSGFFEQRISPGDCEEINVVAQQYQWTFYYPDGDSTPNESGLHLVRNRPVKFILESKDVLHSFFIPAFRQKQDAVPGRYTTTWVKPTKAGTFRLFCSEYCGEGHSLMKSGVVVHETEAERKAATQWEWGDKSPLQNGERLFKMQCSGCHNPTTEKKTGPGLAGIWGKVEEMNDGTTVTVDDNYFRQSLFKPSEHIVKGFTSPSQMTSFDGKLTDDQILWLRIYIKSLSNVKESVEETTDPDKAGADAGEPGNANGDNGGDDKNAADGKNEPRADDNDDAGANAGDDANDNKSSVPPGDDESGGGR